MAHTILINGTNYQVGGGKTLIDGTVYSIMATREVNNTVVVTMNPTSISGQVMTLDNAAFDWSKYKLAGYFIWHGDTNFFGSVYAIGDTKKSVVRYNSSAGVNLLSYTLSEDTSTNGKLVINGKISGVYPALGWQTNAALCSCTIVLEAK